MKLITNIFGFEKPSQNVILVRLSLLLFAVFFTSQMGISQVKIGDNPTTIDDGSLLELESTTKAFVPPRMTTAQRDAIPTPLKGAIIYNCLLYTSPSPRD